MIVLFFLPMAIAALPLLVGGRVALPRGLGREAGGLRRPLPAPVEEPHGGARLAARLCRGLRHRRRHLRLPGAARPFRRHRADLLPVRPVLEPRPLAEPRAHPLPGHLQPLHDALRPALPAPVAGAQARQGGGRDDRGARHQLRLLLAGDRPADVAGRADLDPEQPGDRHPLPVRRPADHDPRLVHLGGGAVDLPVRLRHRPAAAAARLDRRPGGRRAAAA